MTPEVERNLPIGEVFTLLRPDFRSADIGVDGPMQDNRGKRKA
jgi:hypothetical protein